MLKSIVLSIAIGILPVEDLPLINPDTTIVQQSSHNKTGANSDTGFHLYDEREPRRAVLFDSVGPGCIRNMWQTGNLTDLRIEVDGEIIVDAKPDDFYRGKVDGFEKPLVFKGLTASGPWKCVSHWSFVPIGFQDRCRISTSSPHFFHAIAERYRYPEQTRKWRVDQDLSLLKKYWEMNGGDPKPWTGLKEKKGTLKLAPGERIEFMSIKGSGAVASIKLKLAHIKPEILNKLWLRVYWDGQDDAGVDSPAGIFFAAGVSWQDIPSLLTGIKGEWGYCYFPMPFWKGARFVLENRSDSDVEEIGFVVQWSGKSYPKERTGYFRTWFHDNPETALHRDHLLMHTWGRGHYVGCIQTCIGEHYCEGDERFYIDGSRSPALYGTGTEDYYLAACWPSRDNHSPFAGSVGDVVEEASKAKDTRHHAFYYYPACYYRFHLEAPVRFQSEILCGIEHGATNNTKSKYTSLAYYYVQDKIGIAQSDCLRIGNNENETLHQFLIGKKARRYQLNDCFEGDYDDIKHTFNAVAASKTVKVVMSIDPKNKGVRLRRVFDQNIGRQWVDVYVDGERAGSWYDADHNRHKRLAESDFEIIPELVEGKSSIEVEFRPKADSPEWTMLELRALSYR
jgi:D-arabinan exo alpha-(1,3)/(1,5)-arabinofuranosidase (non-reducing end)